jgi:hypothetical protein
MIRVRVFVFIAMPVILGLISCGTTHPAAHLLLYNNSENTTPVSVNISKPDLTTVKSLTSSLAPGLQELDLGRFAKGNYLITATTDNGQISVRKNLSLDDDRWVIINYSRQDSLKIQKVYGYVDTAVLKKINGKYAGIDLYTESRRPPTLSSVEPKKEQDNRIE